MKVRDGAYNEAEAVGSGECGIHIVSKKAKINSPERNPSKRTKVPFNPNDLVTLTAPAVLRYFESRRRDQVSVRGVVQSCTARKTVVKWTEEGKDGMGFFFTVDASELRIA